METIQALSALAALAQETRLAVFRTLVVAGQLGLPAGVIAEQHGIAGPTLSFHLHHLVTGGLLVSRREGRQIFYAVNFAAMRGLLDFLMQDCCQGHPDICGASTTGCPSPSAKRKVP